MVKTCENDCWYSAWLHGAACVGGEVNEEKKIQTYPYSKRTSNQNSQKDKQVRTVPPQPQGNLWPT